MRIEPIHSFQMPRSGTGTADDPSSIGELEPGGGKIGVDLLTVSMANLLLAWNV